MEPLSCVDLVSMLWSYKNFLVDTYVYAFESYSSCYVFLAAEGTLLSLCLRQNNPAEIIKKCSGLMELEPADDYKCFNGIRWPFLRPGSSANYLKLQPREMFRKIIERDYTEIT